MADLTLARLQEALRTGTRISHELATAGSKDEPRDAADWADSPRVDAADLRAVLLGSEPGGGGGQHPSGLTISGFRVVGRLDLGKARLTVPFTARECLFEDVVDLDEAEGVSISLTGSRLQGGVAHGTDPGDADRVQSLRGDSLRLRGTLSLTDGFVAEHGVWLGTAKIDGQLDCAGCTWYPDLDGNALTAFRIQVGNGLLLTRATTRGRVDLTSAQIGYGVDISAGHFSALEVPGAPAAGRPVPVALDLADAVVDGSVVAHELVHLRGQWSLYSANLGEVYVGGGLHAEVEPTAVAVEATGLQCLRDLYADRFRVTGSVVLDDAAVGSLRLSRGRITTDPNHWSISAERLRTSRVDLGARLRLDSLNLAGASIRVDVTLACQVDSGAGLALSLANATVDGRLTVAPECSITGSATWSGLSVGGDCLVGPAWHFPDGIALHGSTLSVGGQLILAPAGLEGSVDLARADVGHDLVMVGAIGARGATMTMTGIHVGGWLRADGDCRLDGSLDLREARVDGSVSLMGVTCGAAPAGTEDGDGAADGPGQSASFLEDAVNLSNADIRGSLYLGFGFTARGTTRLFLTKVGGVVNLRGGSFTSSPGQPAALNAEGLRALSLIAYPTDPTETAPPVLTAFAGGVSLDDAVIHRLNLTDAVFDGQETSALSAMRMSTAGPLYLCPSAVTGRVDLRHAALRQLRVNRTVLAGEVRMLGATYDVIEGPDDPGSERISPADLRALLPQGRDFAAQPYSQLAAVHRASGREDEARRVLIGLRQQQGRQATGRRTHPAWTTSRDALLRATVGFGYYPFRALWSLLAITALGAVLFWFAYPEYIEPARTTGVPDYNAVVYSLDTTLPIIDFAQQAAWTPYSWAQWWAWTSIAAGWVLSTALVAGVTRAIRS